MTDFECLLAMQFDMNTWLDLNPCKCEALCLCEKEKTNDR